MVGLAPKSGARSGSMITELVVAMAILSLAFLPLMGSYGQVQKSVRASYQKAVAMELIDGEMEILLAGQWREFKPGEQPYPLHGDSAKNLPPGKATLTITGNRVRLEWTPDKRGAGGKIIREAVAR